MHFAKSREPFSYIYFDTIQEFVRIIMQKPESLFNSCNFMNNSLYLCMFRNAGPSINSYFYYY